MNEGLCHENGSHCFGKIWPARLTSGDQQSVGDCVAVVPMRSGQPAASCRAPCEELQNMGGSGSGPEWSDAG